MLGHRTLLTAPLWLAATTAPGLAAEIDSVVVTATRIEQQSAEIPAAINAVDGVRLREHQPRIDFGENLGRIPGLNIQNRYNYAQDLQVSSRGFGARASFGVRGVRLIQDGVPLTMPDGQGQTGLFDITGADRVEVLRGPFAALYGNSSGAVIHVITASRPEGSSAEVSATGAEYGVWRAGGSFAADAGPLDITGNLSRFETDGVRAHSAARRDLANLKLAYAPDDRSMLTVLVNALDQPDTQDPLGLTREQLEADPRQAGINAVELNTRKSIRHLQGGLSYRRELGEDDAVRLSGYAGDRDLTQFLANPSTSLTGSGGVVDLARTFGGGALQWDHTGMLAAQPYELSLGVEYDRMSEQRRGYVNDNGQQGDLRRDEDDTVESFSQYVIAQWQATPRWKLAGGARRTEVDFEVDDHFVVGPNPDDSGAVSYASTQPVLGVLFALTPSVNLFASAGKAFETPTLAELAYRPDGAPGLNFDLAPADTRNIEAGVKALLNERTRLEAVLFRANTKQDIVTGPAPFPGRNTFVNAARTRREGAELSFSTAAAQWDLTLAYTYTRARFEEFVNFQGADLSGNYIPAVPAHTAYAELVWRPQAEGFSTGIEARYADRMYVNDANADFADDYGVVHWHAGWRVRRPEWELNSFVRVENLTDADYVGSVIVNAANDRFFEPSPGRLVYLGMSVSYGQ